MIPVNTHRVVRFTPQRTDDLKPSGAIEVNGEPFEVMWAGTMDQGPYDGQVMWMPTDRDRWAGVGWIPDCDLTDATS